MASTFPVTLVGYLIIAMKPRCFLFNTVGVLVVLFSFNERFAAAQTAPAKPAEPNLLYALYDFEKSLAERIKTDPAGAAAAQQAWLAQQKNVKRDVIAMAAIHASQWYEKANDPKSAWEVLQKAFAPMAGRPEGWWVISRQIGLLANNQKTDEAEKLAQKYWQESLNNSSIDVVAAYVGILEAQGKPDVTRALLKKALLDGPLLLETDHGRNRVGWIYDTIINSLQREGKEDEAISWAKLRYIQAPFNDIAIKASTDALTKALLTKNLSPVAVQGFLESQNDPAKKNPLADVPLPIKPEEVTEALKKVPEDARNTTKAHARLNLLLAGGFHREALTLARQVLINNVGSPAGAEEVCRVFKAMDLNLKRGNDFIAFLKTGEGVNPVAEFFKAEKPVEGLQK